MLEFETALNLMRKYGYSSTSVHPYIYRKGDKIGICYSYIDEQYGILERIKVFDDIETFEEFLKKLQWFKENGKKFNVRIVLDNYENEEPKLMFLRNGKLMAKGEMFDIESFEQKESQKKQMDEISRTVYEAGSILLVYDEMKQNREDYYKDLHNLKNQLREKYFELQKEVDYYNDYDVERELVLLPEESVSTTNDIIEYGIKDRYNSYRQNTPTMEDAVSLVKDCWDLCSVLETGDRLYNAHVEENAIRNEFKVVNAKLKYMKELNDMPKTFFKEDVMRKFRSINKHCKANSVLLDSNYVKSRVSSVDKKYAYFDALDFYSLAEYLNEAMEDTSYSDLAIKYAKVNASKSRESVNLPLNQIAASLLQQYQRLSLEEQAILVLYNSMYKNLYNLILDIPDFLNKSIKDIIVSLYAVNGFSKIKSQCYDLVKVRLDSPDNIALKNKVFGSINYDTFESFIQSLVEQLRKMKSINNKMVINSDLITYCYIPNVEEFDKKNYVTVTTNLNAEIAKVKSREERVGLLKIKYSMPVLYSPYTIDFGDLTDKNASAKMSIKVVTGFELLIDKDDVLIVRDENAVTVVKYFSEPKIVQDVTIVDDIKMSGQTTFVRMSLFNNISEKTQTQVGQRTENALASQVSIENSLFQPSLNTTSVVRQVSTNQQSVVLVNESPVTPVFSGQQRVAPDVKIGAVPANVIVQPENNVNGEVKQ